MKVSNSKAQQTLPQCSWKEIDTPGAYVDTEFGHDVPLRARQREPERTDLRSTADLCGQRHPASILITTAAGSEIVDSDPASGRPLFCRP